MNQVSAPVAAIEEITPGRILLWLEASQIACQAKPGQFLMVRCGEDTILRRPISIHQVDGNRLALLFAVVGKGTEWLSGLHVEDEIDLLGPLGNGYEILPDTRNLLLVAGGIGIAPLRFLVDTAIQQDRNVILLSGEATAAHLYPLNLFTAGVTLFTTTEDGTFGVKGMITDILADYSRQADQVFACGPLPMYQTMAQMTELNNKSVQVSLEVRMGCGRGLCYGCTIKTRDGLKQVCTDGPVFYLDDVLWNELSC